MRITAGRRAACLAVLVVASGCSAPPPSTTSPASEDSPSVTGTASARAGATETVPYDDLGHEMDIYHPEPDSSPVAMVLLVHGVGSGSHPKDHPGLVAWGTRLSDAGIVAAVPDYDASVGGSEAGREQLARAVAVLRERATAPGAEQPALVTMGFSAGGADWVTASFDPANQPVSALVGYYADIEPGPREGAARERSLSSRMSEVAKPLLLAYGERDDAPGILQSLRTFRRSATSPAGRTTILTHPRAGHAFDLTDDARTREIIRRTVRFISQVRR